MAVQRHPAGSRPVILPTDAPPERPSRLELGRFASDVVRGLSQRPKTLSSKYFYDERGTHLFDRITTLPEYYLTRAELEILERHGNEIAHRLGPRAMVVEVGSGTPEKIRLLLSALEHPVAYAPVDVSRRALESSSAAARAASDEVEILPVADDFAERLRIPVPRRPPRRIVVFFPGSTIGNFEPHEASELLRRLATSVGDPRDGVRLLVGVDLPKGAAELERAYDDAEGVTAAFDLNLLARINRELDATFDLDAFEHEARWSREERRIEMYLRSVRDQSVCVGELRFRFKSGERIRTEVSYKHDRERLESIAHEAGLLVREGWTDEAQRFAEFLLEPLPPPSRRDAFSTDRRHQGLGSGGRFH